MASRAQSLEPSLLCTLVWALHASIVFGGPFSLVLAYTFRERDFFGGVLPGSSLSALQRLADERLGRVIWRSLGAAGSATAACLVIGIPIALVLWHSEQRLARRVLAIMLLPTALSSVLVGHGWRLMLGNAGIIN